MAVGGSSGGGGKGVKAGRAYVEVGVDDKSLRGGLNKAKQMVLTFSKQLAIGGGVLTGLGATVTAPILAFFHDAIDRVNSFRKAAEQLGTTPEIISAIGYAADKVGVDLGGLVQAGRRVQRVIADAAAGEEGAAAALDRLGISAQNILNLPLDEQFGAIADGLQAIQNPAERQAAAFDILGRAGVQLLPILAKGSAGLRALMDEAKDIGGVIKSEDAARAKEFTVAMKQAKAAVHFLFEEIGLSILPQAGQFAEWVKQFTTVVKMIRVFIEENRPLIATVFLVAATITTIGTALIALGSALAVTAFAVGGFAAAASTIIAWAPTVAIIAGVAAAIAGLGYVLYEFTPLGEHAVRLFGEIGRLGSWAGGVLKTAWSGIKTALALGDAEGAIKVVTLALDVFWQALKVGGLTAWNFVKKHALGAWDDILGFAKKTYVDIRAEAMLVGVDTKQYLQKAWRDIMKYWKEETIANGKAIVRIMATVAREVAQIDVTMRKWMIEKIKGNISSEAPSASALAAPADTAIADAAKGQALARRVGKESAEKIIESVRKRLKEEIDAATAARKAAREANDQAALDEQITALKQAQKALDEEVTTLKEKELKLKQKELFQRGLDLALKGLGVLFPGPQRQDAINAMGAVRGQFGGAGLSSAMFSSGESIQKEQLKRLIGIEENTEDIGGLNGV